MVFQVQVSVAFTLQALANAINQYAEASGLVLGEMQAVAQGTVLTVYLSQPYLQSLGILPTAGTCTYPTVVLNATPTGTVVVVSTQPAVFQTCVQEDATVFVLKQCTAIVCRSECTLAQTVQREYTSCNPDDVCLPKSMRLYQGIIASQELVCRDDIAGARAIITQLNTEVPQQPCNCH
jgi:hypothetical protein